MSYDKTKNVCESNKVPSFSINCKGGMETFVIYVLEVNDLLKTKDYRLTRAELKIAANTIIFILENGEINNKEIYKKYLDYLCETKSLSTKSSWNQMKKMIKDKGFFIGSSKQNSVVVQPNIMKLISYGKVCLYVSM